MIEFILPIKPTAQKRAKSTARGGRASTYKDKGQREDEEDIMSLMAQYRPLEPLSGALKLKMVVLLEIPRSKSKKWKQRAVDGEVLPDKRPDLDNYVKQIMDCMTKLGFWYDDAQVCELEAMKIYSNNPGWIVQVKEIINHNGG